MCSEFTTCSELIIWCSKLEPFCDTEKWAHLRIWAEMTPMLMPKSTKVAQIHLPERNSAKIHQISPNFRQNSPKFVKFPPISPN